MTKPTIDFDRLIENLRDRGPSEIGSASAIVAIKFLLARNREAEGLLRDLQPLVEAYRNRTRKWGYVPQTERSDELLARIARWLEGK